MQPDEIKIGHCYFIGTHNRRRVVAQVTRFIDQSIDGGDGSSRRNVAKARFLWRNAAYRSGWSRYEQQLPLSVFAQLATEDVAAV